MATKRIKKKKVKQTRAREDRGVPMGWDPTKPFRNEEDIKEMVYEGGENPPKQAPYRGSY